MSFQTICSFCFSDVNNENVGLITDTTKEILDLLLINIDLGDRSDHAICNVCSERLLAAFEFKSTCKYTDATIIPYIDWEKPTQLDLWDIYLRERDNKQTVTLLEDEQVCRLCMELTGKMHVPLQDIDKDEFQKFLPEINMTIIKHPVVCKTCFDAFATHSKFLKKLKNCVDQQEEIKNLGCPRKLSHTDELLAVTMEEVDTKLEDNPSIDSCMQSGPIKLEIEECKQTFIKYEDIETDFEYDQTRNMDNTDEVLPITTEEVDIKVEDESSIDSCIQLEQIKLEIEECDQPNIKTELENDVTSSLVSEIHPVAIESKGQTTQTETRRAETKNGIGCIYNCDICDYKTNVKRSLEMHSVVHQDPLKLKQFTCDLCSFRTNHVSSLKRHELMHKDPSEVHMYKCDICAYETKYKAKLKYHQLVHKDPSELQMYRCDICDFETKRKDYLKMHQEIHKDVSEKNPSKAQTYNCDICDYKTKVKHSFRLHCIMHQDPSKIKQFTCDLCDYRTIRVSTLKRHQLVHKGRSQVQKHKCDICSYETNYKATLKYHQLVHKDPSEVQMFNCNNCEYRTKIKADLKRHQLKHKDPSEVQMYKCATCDYETKIKSWLKSHLLKHKDPSQVQMHKCDICTYETKYKTKLKRHELVHKDPSQVPRFSCDDCEYKTKCKAELKKHQLKHKDPSEVQMYKCTTCDYETKIKDLLKSHLLKHKDPSEVQMFKCAKCSYETRRKSNLSRHYKSQHLNPS